jgi:hypothetical protein
VNSVSLDDAVRKIEQASGTLATLSLARMDEQLRWFRALPAEQRSWVTLVAQAGIASFVEWLREPDHKMRLTGEVFGAAPRELARAVTLQQTVELVELMISVVEEKVPALVRPDQQTDIQAAVLRFSREIAFAAARVYAAAAESRGAWDARLEAFVIDGLVRGSAANADDASPVSQAAALGWRSSGRVAAIVGAAGDLDSTEILAGIHRIARRLGLDVLAGVHGGRLVVLLGGLSDQAHAMRAADALLEQFGAGPVVVGPIANALSDAGPVTSVALAGLRAVAGWPGAARLVAADDLLPERALDGDEVARRALVELVYRSLQAGGDVLVETVTAFLDNGGALEATARTLFVHPNTVRYRLRRVSEVCGQAPTTPRGAWTIQLALAYGRLSAQH